MLVNRDVDGALWCINQSNRYSRFDADLVWPQPVSPDHRLHRQSRIKFALVDDKERHMAHDFIHRGLLGVDTGKGGVQGCERRLWSQSR